MEKGGKQNCHSMKISVSDLMYLSIWTTSYTTKDKEKELVPLAIRERISYYAKGGKGHKMTEHLVNYFYQYI